MKTATMPHEFTPAAERALAYAAHWWRRAPDGTGVDELGAAELLLGLLGEPECRAALLAAARGVGIDAVRARWPELEPAAAATLDWKVQQSAQVRQAIEMAEAHLADYPQPHVLATEHLLLGLSTGSNEVAQWLATKGWNAAELVAEIDRLAGHDRGHLPLEFDVPATEATHAPPAAAAEHVDAESAGHAAPAGVIQTADHEAIARLRILDAAGNRAGEAVRVVEDYARFVLDDRHLAGECKALRHGLTAALSAFPSAQRHAARETRADVGTTLSLASEQQRADLRAVMAANFKRLEQALRSLEEYAKGAWPAAAAALEQMRYRAYTLERAIDITADSLDRLADARLYVLIDGHESAEALARWVDTLVGAGVDMIQLRDKRLADGELLARARVVRRQTHGTRTLLIMNDRPDIARLAGADGVHVGQEELSVKDARSIVGPDALVGRSTHSLQQAREAVLDGANYIGVGPVFPSSTKQFVEFPGLELLRAVSNEIRLPAFAIGGIDAGNLADVRACGFDRVAVSGAVSKSASPADTVRELKQRLA
ncbi:MAG TPA: thiamine phosphate synthase [Pirellulales bacterium]|nr:thiamine phosphate synthase [Pirellulales bacterium]